MVIALIVQSAVLMTIATERQRSISASEMAFKDGLNDVASLFNLDINSMNQNDRIYYYSRAIAGIEVANYSLSQFDADQSMYNGIYLLSEHIKELDILGGDSGLIDFELYNLIVNILMDIEDVDSADRLTEYLNNSDKVN